MAGRTKSRNETNALTGLPGRVKTGVPPKPIRPKPCGMPGCMATLRNLMANEPSAALTTSCSPPMLTPPVVTSRSAETLSSSSAVTSATGSSFTRCRRARPPAWRAMAASM